MPVELKGSCRCGAVRFAVASNTPVPYQLCYCSICRKQQGGGGYAINLAATASTLSVEGEGKLGTFHAQIQDDENSVCELSTAERRFCRDCGSAVWLYDSTAPELVHPFASAIDTDLPEAPSRVHLMLKYKAAWVVPNIGPNDDTFDLYPEKSIEEWHKDEGQWLA